MSMWHDNIAYRRLRSSQNEKTKPDYDGRGADGARREKQLYPPRHFPPARLLLFLCLASLAPPPRLPLLVGHVSEVGTVLPREAAPLLRRQRLPSLTRRGQIERSGDGEARAAGHRSRTWGLRGQAISAASRLLLLD